MRSSEWITLGYFAYLAIVGLSASIPPARRRVVILLGISVATVIVGLANAPLSPVTAIVRDWLPGAYLLLGYWLSGLFFVAADRQIERLLLAGDERVFAAGLERFVRRAPRVVLEYFELTYLFCYPLVPAGLAVLYLSGMPEEANRFWTIVLLATFLAYGALPWMPTRPPRALESEVAIEGRGLLVRRLNLAVLRQASIQVNTFPSGHAAAAFATALALAQSLPVASAAFFVVAVSIAVASVLGRYHYVADALLGGLAAAAAFLLVAVIERFLARLLIAGC
jgi:membrane-associated phospholipid phosphatase